MRVKSVNSCCLLCSVCIHGVTTRSSWISDEEESESEASDDGTVTMGSIKDQQRKCNNVVHKEA